MATATSSKIKVTTSSSNYCWLILDYSMSGQTMTYSVTLHFDGGCAQFRNIYVKVGNTTVSSGGSHAYNASHVSSAHNATIFSNKTTTVTGTQTITFGGEKYYDGSTWLTTSGSVSVTGGVAPTGLTINLDSFTDTTATFSVAVGSYQTPASATGRYVEAAILGGSTYGNPYRYAIASNVSSATLTVGNTSSTGSTPLTVMGNTQYHYGVYANNTAMSSNSVASSTFVTLPAYITGITAKDLGDNNVNIVVNHAAEGSAQTVTTKYSLDGTTWTNASDNFNLVVTEPKTIYFKRESSSGSTPIFSTTVSPVFSTKLYGYINPTTHKIVRLYGRVNSTTHEVEKLYGTIDGKSQPKYEG